MSNNFIMTPFSAIGITKDGADALGGTLDAFWTTNGVTYSNDLLTAQIGGNRATGSVNNITSGKKYFEMTITDWPTRYGPLIGVTPGGGYTDPGAIAIWTVDAGSVGLYDSGNQIGSFPNVQIGPGDTVGVLVDMVAHTVSFFKNGVATGIVASITATNVKAFAASAGGAYPVTITANFGGKAFM